MCETCRCILQVSAACGGNGLPLQPDALARLCCCGGPGTALPKAHILAALSGLHDSGGACGAAAAQLMRAAEGGLVSWLRAGAAPDQAMASAPSHMQAPSAPLPACVLACMHAPPYESVGGRLYDPALSHGHSMAAVMLP